jgi:uncharacterized membrane protein
MRPAQWISLVLVALMTGGSIYGARVIPEDALLPIHWGIRGDADGYAPRNVMLILFPALGAGISLLFAAIPYIDPRKEHIRRSPGLYYASWMGVLIFLAALHFVVIAGAMNGAEPHPSYILISICILIALLGNFLTKSRSNWFMGVRTPWSLDSEKAWIAANRTTGWLFVLSSIAALAAAYVANIETGYVVLFAGIVAAAAIGIAVSFFVWRDDREQAQ